MRMNVIRFMVFLCSAAFMAGCSGNSGEYVLTGKFENCGSPYALIKYGETVEDMDTVPLADDGSFRYARKMDAPRVSFMMVPETGFFPLLLINGTENHIEADLNVVGDVRVTGDLEDAHVLHSQLQQEIREQGEKEYDSFKACENALADIRREAVKKMAAIPNADFRRIALKDVDDAIFLILFTWMGRLQDENRPLSSDPDYNRYMLECDINRPDYLASGLITYNLGWCRAYRAESGAKDAWRYVLTRVADKIFDPQLREKVYMSVLADFFAGEDVDNEAEAVYAQGLSLLQDVKNREEIKGKYEIFQKLRPGADAVECELETIDGKTFKFSDLRGKAVYLDVWATWCGPCCEEIPYMEKLAKHFKNDPRIAIVSVSVDANRKAWEKKLKNDRPEWKQFLQKDFCKLYNINGIPRFMMFDKKGKIITVDAPRPSDSEIIPFIESRLK